MLPEKINISYLRNKYMIGELTPWQVISELRARIERDKEMNIWITVMDEDSVQVYLDKLQKYSPDELPLWGIPFAIKDNIDLAGIPTTAACPAYTYMPEESAWVVNKLIEAGAVPIGKTNMDQFATGLVGTRSPYGETFNALNPEYISGGSSSGSAVAVAKGHVAFSLGTDTAGSGRVPAMFNRIVGLKPAPGEWSINGLVRACESLDCISVFAHTVEEAALIDNICGQQDLNDVWTKRSNTMESGDARVVFVPSNPLEFFGDHAEAYSQAWDHALAALRRTGVIIRKVDCSVFFDAAKLLYEGPYVAERYAGIEQFIAEHEEDLFPVTRQIICSTSAEMRAVDLFHAIHMMQRYRNESWKLLENAMLIMPTAGGIWKRDQVREDPIKTNSKLGLYTNHCNLLGLFGIAVPAGDAADHLAFGVTVFSIPENRTQAIRLAQIIRKSCETVEIAVCGLHMRGFPLQKQLLDIGAVYLRIEKTAPEYKLYRLPTEPVKPGLVRSEKDGASIEVEIWLIHTSEIGNFISNISSPLSIGSIKLQDGSYCKGFVCESYIIPQSEDITAYGGWRNWCNEKGMIT